jgi:two-component system, cell cycle sensor histidine kinase and response regulator CckA
VSSEKRKSRSADRSIAFDDVPIPAWLYDPETLAILAANRTALEVYGYTAKEMLALTLKDLHPEEDVPLLLAYLARTRDDSPADYAASGTWQHKMKDGNVVWVEIKRGSAAFEGRDVQLIMAHDVTGHRRSGQALLKSQELLTRAQQIAHLGSWEIEYLDWPAREDAVVITRSEETYQILGITPEEALDDLLDYVFPDDREAVRNAMQLAEQSTGRFDLEHRILRPDGSVRHVRQSGQVTADGDGRPVRMTGIIQDLTEYKRLEELFRQAQKMESVGRLAGAVAHDFNNLLTVIRGYADVVYQRMDPTDPMRDFLNEIKKAGEKAGALTSQLLAVSRRQLRQAQVVDLNAVISDVDKMLRRLIGEDIELIASRHPEPALVMGDVGQLHQILMNLSVNARDAMPNGGKLIIATDLADVDEEYAAQHGELQPGRYVLLVVSDTGVGMTEEVRSHLFEPFFTTKPRGIGTGLGLATVWGIVHQGGGVIRAHTSVGVGTTFTIYFPHVGSESEIPAPKPLERAEEKGTETVLVVEDQEDVRKFVTTILGSRGYKVMPAPDGPTAMRVFERAKGNVDLLLTDVVMPGMTGKELADRLVRVRPQLKVLFMSGYTEDVIAHQGVKDNGVAFIAKPFTPEALAGKVREALSAAIEGPERAPIKP